MIHDTSIVDKNAKIGNNVEIGPYCVVGPNVKIADNNKSMPPKSTWFEPKLLDGLISMPII